MNSNSRSHLAALLAALGALGIYAGSLLNAAALGGTIGYVAILPGIVLVGASAIPILRTIKSTEALLLAKIFRYACLPPFILSTYFIVVALLDPQPTYGLSSAAALTAAGFGAITWPDIWRMLKGKQGHGR